MISRCFLVHNQCLEFTRSLNLSFKSESSPSDWTIRNKLLQWDGYTVDTSHSALTFLQECATSGCPKLAATFWEMYLSAFLLGIWDGCHACRDNTDWRRGCLVILVFVLSYAKQLLAVASYVAHRHESGINLNSQKCRTTTFKCRLTQSVPVLNTNQ